MATLKHIIKATRNALKSSSLFISHNYVKYFGKILNLDHHIHEGKLLNKIVVQSLVKLL